MATVSVQARVTHPALTSVALGGGHRGLFLVSLCHWPSHLQILMLLATMSLLSFVLLVFAVYLDHRERRDW